MDRLLGSQAGLHGALGGLIAGLAVAASTACLVASGTLQIGCLLVEFILLALVWATVRSYLQRVRIAADAPPAKVDIPKPETPTQSERALVTTALEALRDDVLHPLDTIGTTSTALNQIADELTRAILRITTETTSVAVAAEDVHRQIRTVEQSQTDFLATISQIGEHATLSATMGDEASDLTQAASTTIQELASASEQIGTMIELISRIANQTNLLALNATIEAARAGEQGRGFAVVAAEVKGLARESANAAAMIVDAVDAIRRTTGRATEAISATAQSIGGLNRATSDIAAAVEERVKASASMARSVTATAGTVSLVAAAIGKIEAVVDEAVQGAGFLRSTAGQITDQTSCMRERLQTCVAAVRSPTSMQRLKDDPLTDPRMKEAMR